jgi:hypothetical protein
MLRLLGAPLRAGRGWGGGGTCEACAAGTAATASRSATAAAASVRQPRAMMRRLRLCSLGVAVTRGPSTGGASPPARRPCTFLQPCPTPPPAGSVTVAAQPQQAVVAPNPTHTALWGHTHRVEPAPKRTLPLSHHACVRAGRRDATRRKPSRIAINDPQVV